MGLFDRFSRDRDEDEDDRDEIDVDDPSTWYDKPFCCKACGGPYPDCMDSCNVFDD